MRSRYRKSCGIGGEGARLQAGQRAGRGAGTSGNRHHRHLSPAASARAGGAARNGGRQACSLRKAGLPAAFWKRTGVAAAAREHNRLFVPIFQYRYGRELNRLAALQERGLTGRPLVATLETHWDRGADYYAVDWRGRWASERGGAVLGHAIHIHDLITRFFGPVTALSAMLDTRVNPIETEDCAAIAMTTRSGGLVTSSVTLGSAATCRACASRSRNLTAESGRNPYAPGEDRWFFRARGRAGSGDTQCGSCRDRCRAGGPAHRVCRSVRGHRPAACRRTGRSGEASRMESVPSKPWAAIYHAARTGTQVMLPLDRSLPVCADWVHGGVQGRMTRLLNHPDRFFPAIRRACYRPGSL